MMVEDERSLNRKIGLCLRLTIRLDPKPGSIRRLEVITGMERRRQCANVWKGQAQQQIEALLQFVTAA
jgi:hypothetical protein